METYPLILKQWGHVCTQSYTCHYVPSLRTIKRHFEGKTPRPGKVTKGVLFLHHNAPAHQALATQKKLAYLGCQCFDHPHYSPDLAPSDYHLFPGLKKTTERSPFFVRRYHCCRGDLVRRTFLFFE